jgi:hypothetical protein
VRARPQHLTLPTLHLPQSVFSLRLLQVQSRQNSAQQPLCHWPPIHCRPNRPVSPFLHGVSATRSAFLPFVHLNTRLQPYQDRFQRRHPFCTLRESGRHIAVRSIRVTCPCPRCCCARANEFYVAITQEWSGEPLKLSLKAKPTPARGSPTLITDPVGLSPSKNALTTPAHEDVHLHSQLEHVKLFLSEQNPLAVSRWQPSGY